jgi:hypothetical protein
VRKNILNRAPPKLQETTTTEARPKEAAEETLPLKGTSAEAKKVPGLPENPGGLTIVLPSPPEDAVIVSAPETSADSEADAVTADSPIAVEETKEEELEEELVEEEQKEENPVIEDPELLPLITTLKVRFSAQRCIQYYTDT